MIQLGGFRYESSYTGFDVNKNDAKCPLAVALREAIDKYIDDMTRGLFALCDEEIAARIAEFKEKFYPEGGTDEQISAFYDKLLAFTHALHKKAERTGGQPLITTAAAAEQEMDCFAAIIRGKITQAASYHATT